MSTEGQLNQEQFEKLLLAFNPELFKAYKSLRQYKISPKFLPILIKAIRNICDEASGYGEITVYLQNKTITDIKALTKYKLNFPVESSST